MARQAVAEVTITHKGVAWFIFCAACLHLAFVQPNPELVAGERAPVFSGLVCLVAWGAVIGSHWRTLGRYLGVIEVAVGCVLSVLALASGLASDTPQTSTLRSVILAASAFGGFCCGRVWLVDPRRQRFFLWLCVAMFAGLLPLALPPDVWEGHFGQPGEWGWQMGLALDGHAHPVACRLFLLALGPLALIIEGGRKRRWGAVALLAAAYWVFYLSRLRAALLLPLAVLVLAWLRGRIGWRIGVPMLVGCATVLVVLYQGLPPDKVRLDREPAYYRVESVPFAWHVARQHPWLGVGLRSPKAEYLRDYSVVYPYVDKARFARSLDIIVTQENTFLTFLAELGVPFTLLFAGALWGLAIRGTRAVRSPASLVLPPAALAYPLVAAFLYCQLVDGFLHPQVAWYFFVVLGFLTAHAGPVGRAGRESQGGSVE